MPPRGTHGKIATTDLTGAAVPRGLRAGAALHMSGRYAFGGRMAAEGLRAWADLRGAYLEVIDSQSRDDAVGDHYADLSERCEVLFGPYGSGATRAAAAVMGPAATPLWNHAGAAARPTSARMIDVLAPAERYWAGLPAALTVLGPVGVLGAPSGFGRAVAAGAVRSLAAAGYEIVSHTFTEASASALSEQLISEGVAAIIGCGRLEDDVALGRALVGWDGQVGLVVCGVQAAAQLIGPGIEGWIGPAQWLSDAISPAPVAVPALADYPWAQALAAGLLAERAIIAAGSTEPDAMWNAARRMRTTTFFGPFAVDETGAQVAATPHLVRWERSALGLTRRQIART